MSANLYWNGGRNGCRSFLLGFGWIPAFGGGDWTMHIYLGLWVLTARGRR